MRYELAGGFIKNAMHNSLLAAVARDGPENPTITQADIEEGCALQMRGSLKMKSFRHRVVPTAGLEQLVLSDRVRDWGVLFPARSFLFCASNSLSRMNGVKKSTKRDQISDCEFNPLHGGAPMHPLATPSLAGAGAAAGSRGLGESPWHPHGPMGLR